LFGVLKGSVPDDKDDSHIEEQQNIDPVDPQSPEQADEDDESFYDSKSSFFDNISCDLKDRATNDGQRYLVIYESLVQSLVH
jgi:hypothetical protein